MEQIELHFSPSLKEAQLATIATANISKAFYEIVTGYPPALDNRFIAAIELAIGEASSNSAKYYSATNEKDGKIAICFRVKGEVLEILIKDQNEAFDFSGTDAPDFSTIPEQGYGIFIMKSIMDKVTYGRIDGWNVISMKKELSARR